MATTKNNEYKTDSNNLFQWKHQLKPRLTTGFIGDYTIVLHLSGDEVAQIQTEHKDQIEKLSSKSEFEAFVLEKLFNIKRVPKVETVATADKTDAETNEFVLNLIKAGKTKTEIVMAMLDAGFSKDQIKKAFETPKSADEKLKLAEQLIKEMAL